MKSFNVNLTEMTDLMMMTAVKKLRQLGAAVRDDATADDVTRRLITLLNERLPDIMAKCSEDLDMLFRNGADDRSLDLSAKATFALAGADLAETVHRARIAAYN